MVRGSRWFKAAALAAAMLGGASAASAYTSSAVIRAGEGLATKVLASADAGAAQVTLWPGSGLVQGYARSLAAGGDATGFTLTQQSGLHRSRAGELLPSRAESWQLVKGTNETPGNADVRVSLTAPADSAQSIGTFAGGEVRSYTDTTLDASVRDFHINPGASATQEALLGELLLLSAQGRNVTPTLVPTSAGSRIYDVHIPVLDGTTIRGGVPAQIELNTAGTHATLRYTNTCLATNCADPGVDVSMRLAGPGGESAAITWRGPGNFDAPVTVNLTPLVSGCTPNQYTLCPQGGKFKVTLNWRDFAGNTGGGKATALSNESGDYWFFDPTNNEEILKIIDACSYSGNYWVFWKALSNVEMDLSITDTQTNQVLTYHNPLGFIPNGHLDTNTIFRCDGSGPATQHYDTQRDLPPPGAPHLIKYVDPALIAPCVPNGDRAICVQNNRFKIEGSWVDFQGNSGYAHMIKKNEQSGYLWFFSPSNYEGLFKVLDACGYSGNYWVFAAGLTNVEAVLRFTDTWTGTVYEQRNARGVDFPTNLDTNTNFTDCSAVAPHSATVPVTPQLTELLTAADATDVWSGLETIRARTSVSVNGGEAGHVTGVGYAPSVSPSFRLDGVTIRAFDNQFDADGLADFNHDPEEHLEAKLALVQTRQGLAYQLTTHPNNTDAAGSGTDLIEIAVTTAAGTLRVNNNGTSRAVLLANDGEVTGALQSDAVFDADARLTYQLLPQMMNTLDCEDRGFDSDCRNTETVVGPTTTSGTHLLKGYGLHTNGTDNGVIAATVQNTYVQGHLENSPFVVVAAQTAIPADREMLFWIKHIEPRGEFYTNFSGQGNIRLNPRVLSSEGLNYPASTTDADVTWTTPFPAP